MNSCTRCGHVVVEDRAFNTLMQRYGLPQRRSSCLNAHSVYEGVAVEAPAPRGPSGRATRRDAR
jgi:hypothetical protein